jgi:hypothetical protein
MECGHAYYGYDKRQEAQTPPKGDCVCGEWTKHWFGDTEAEWPGSFQCGAYRYDCRAPRAIKIPTDAMPKR